MAGLWPGHLPLRVALSVRIQHAVIRSDQSAFLAFPDLLARLGHSFPGICQHRLSKGVHIEVENRPGDSDSDLKADLHAPHVHYIQCASDFANIGLFWAQIHFQRLGHIRRRVSGHLHCQSGGLYDHSRRVLRPEWRRRPAADEPQESRAAVPLWHRVHCPTLTRRRTFSGTTRRCTTTCATTISTKSKPESKLSNEGKYTGSGNGNDKHRAIAEERNAMECPATMRQPLDEIPEMETVL
ncbi:uncharacterized protein LOC124342181 [Daphnia pulicaria]|uniref:uncharacterized protein LOC124342181 n=1 Tax=Daphnia pulicaria TaxID=35523 RepID=UPI001EEA5715|nr:uncharacterized protein LOC124342181 [Daphnia pulicaria]